jgi:D-inositol-3-phosphate glycosyltransferase
MGFVTVDGHEKPAFGLEEPDDPDDGETITPPGDHASPQGDVTDAAGEAGVGDPARVAIISLHTSPRDQPGAGDSGGMNVYILSVAERLAEQGIAVDIFTRSKGTDAPEVEEIAPLSRIIQVHAGPSEPVPKEDLPGVLPTFLEGVLNHAAAEDPRPHRHSPYDVVHSHYWLSGWVGSHAKEIWGAPLVASFHTLGRVKNSSGADVPLPEPPIRLAAEQHVIRGADRIVAPTPREADELVSLYGADRERIRVVAPGVDRRIFAPKQKEEARHRLRLGDRRLVLFVGRLQPFKGPDVAIRAFALARSMAPAETLGAVLWIVGGPAADGRAKDQAEELSALAVSLGVGDRVTFFPPQPHERLADFYSASEAILVPSRSESFGLVALEAQACGTPVIGTATGGLRYVVEDGASGFLVEGHDPEAYARRLLAVLAEPELASRFSQAAVRNAGRFSWDLTTAELRAIYRELLRRRAA